MRGTNLIIVSYRRYSLEAAALELYFGGNVYSRGWWNGMYEK